MSKISPFIGINLKQRSEVEVPAPTQSLSSTSSPSPPQLEETGLNTGLNDSGQPLNLDAQCSQRRCSGRGQCIKIDGDTACVCSLGYSGDLCQDNLLKSMQGPILYGAAGLCAGLVVIAVMTVVVKRKRNANTRFETNQKLYILLIYNHAVAELWSSSELNDLNMLRMMMPAA